MSLIHTFADNHTQNHIHYGFALGVGAGRNVAPGKRVELTSGRNCFPGVFHCAQGRFGQQALEGKPCRHPYSVVYAEQI
jgi:hypothetical protein